MYKLPVGKIIVGAFLLPWWNRRQYSVTLAMPTLLFVAVWAAWTLSEKYGAYIRVSGWIYVFIYLLCFSIFAVTCHRLILVEHAKYEKRMHLNFSAREMRFFIWVIGIYVIVAVVQMIPMTIYVNLAIGYRPQTETNIYAFTKFIASIPALYLLGRLSLVFPSVAVDKPITLSKSWKCTRKNGFRMFVVVGIFPAALSAVLSIIARDEPTLVEQVILGLLVYLTLAIEIFALSLSYKEMAPNCEHL